MKRFCIIITILTIHKIVVSQSGFDYKIDTISVRNDSVFALIKTYNYDTLTAEMTGYVSKDSVNSSIFRRIFLLKNIFKKYTKVIRVQVEGNYIQYNYAGKGKKIDSVSNGKWISERYFNKANEEVSSFEFYGGYRTFCLDWQGVIHLIK
jgi:hypothetical protein